MADPVSRALAGPADGGIGLILHLGAGTCRELAAYLACGARDVVLVEPEPVAARRLAQRIAGYAHVQLFELAVAAEDGSAELQLFNLAPLSSLRAPAELATLFPGLRRIAAVPVTATTPDGLLAILPPARPAPDILVIDTPGEEETVIAGLLAAGALPRFRDIFLWAGTGVHYAGSAPAARLLRRLEAAGYRLLAMDDSDPDRPCLHLRSSSQFVPLAAGSGTPTAGDLRIRNVLARYAATLAMQNRALVEQAEAQTVRLAALARVEAELAQRDSDLAELRQRHAALAARTARQDTLIAQITQRLSLASTLLGRPDDGAPRDDGSGR